MSTTTSHYNLVKPAGSEAYDVDVQNGNMDKIDAALWNLPATYKRSLTTSDDLNNLSDGVYYITSNMPLNVPTENDISYSLFFQISSSVIKHQYIIKPFSGLVFMREYSGTSWQAWRKPGYGEILSNSSSSDQRIFLERNGKIYHLHYERYSTVANGTQVTTLNRNYAPSTAAIGKCWFMQSSGYAVVRCTVGTSGAVTLSADTYNQNLAGVFDVYWEK